MIGLGMFGFLFMGSDQSSVFSCNGQQDNTIGSVNGEEIDSDKYTEYLENFKKQNLEDEDKRAKTDKERLRKSQDTIELDIEREKNIILEAQSNEKRLNEEKNVLINTEKQYYDLEKQTENDLQIATEELRKEQDKLEKISKELIINPISEKDSNVLKNSLDCLEKSQECIKNNNIDEATNFINKTKDNLKILISKLKNKIDEKTLDEFNNLNNKIKISQEKYANAFSKNQTIKTDSIKRSQANGKSFAESFLNPELVKDHYRYCNDFIWPVMHDLPEHATYRQFDRERYCQFNSQFARVIEENYVQSNI